MWTGYFRDARRIGRRLPAEADLDTSSRPPGLDNAHRLAHDAERNLAVEVLKLRIGPGRIRPLDGEISANTIIEQHRGMPSCV